MPVCRRTILLGGVAAAFAQAGFTPVQADGLKERDMTKPDYDRITETRQSDPNEPQAEKPIPVHDFSKDDTKAIKDPGESGTEGGVRRIDSDVWQNATPEQRDEMLREIRKTLPDDAVLVITVPKGNVWQMPRAKYDRLKQAGTVRDWTRDEINRLPLNRPDGDESHSDMRGSGPPPPRVRRRDDP